MSRGRPTERGGPRPVYSTEHGRLCPECGAAAADCRCGTRAGSRSSLTAVRVGRQTRGRKGKGVTVVCGLPLSGPELQSLARSLKRLCGSGGTVRDGMIEIQGDHRDAVVAELVRRGWQAKRSGG